VLEGLESEARQAKKGLWVDPAPIPPWVYRKARRGQSLDLSDLVPLSSETELSLPDKIMCSRGRFLKVAVRFPQGRTEHTLPYEVKAPPCDLIHTLLH